MRQRRLAAVALVAAALAFVPVGGDCVLANGDVEKLQLFVTAAYSAATGHYAGAGVLNPVP